MWDWIKSLFRKKPPVYNGGYGTTKPFTPVWGFIAPHTLAKGGAYNKFHKIDEYRYALKMYEKMEVTPVFETRDVGGVSGAAKRLKARGITASIENHKNAYNTKANGFEVLYLYGDELSKEYALLLVEEVKRFFPNLKIRRGDGLVPIKSKGRGYGNLKAAKKHHKVALLTEFFFIDNNNDYIKPEKVSQFWDEFLK